MGDYIIWAHFWKYECLRVVVILIVLIVVLVVVVVVIVVVVVVVVITTTGLCPAALLARQGSAAEVTKAIPANTMPTRNQRPADVLVLKANLRLVSTSARRCWLGKLLAATGHKARYHVR